MLAFLLVSVGASPRASGNVAARIGELRPDQVVTLVSFWNQIQTIDEREWKAFTPRSWTDLAKHLHAYVVQQGSTRATWKTLRQSRFRACLPAAYTRHYEQLRAVAAGVDADDLPIKGEGVPPDVLQRDAEGRVVVPVPKDIAEILWLLQAIEPWLHDASTRWERQRHLVTANDGGEALRQELIGVIYDYIYAQKRLAKLRLVAALPNPLDELLGINRNELTAFLDRFEALTDYSNAVEGLADSSLEEAQRVLDEARARAAREIAPMLDELERRSLAVKRWIDRHGKELQRLGSYYRELLDTRHIDVPRDAAAQSKAFIRFTIEAPGSESCRGTKTTVQAEVALCRATTGLTAQPTDDPSSMRFNERDDDGAPATYEQIPLGITISGLRFGRERGRGPMLVPRPSLAPTVRVAEPTLRRALHRLGVPEAVSIGNIRVRMSRLDRFEITARLTAPQLSAGLPDLAVGARGADVTLTIDGAEISVQAELPFRELLRAQIDAVQKKHDEALQRALVSKRSSTLVVERVEAQGRWSDGLIGYRVGFRLLKVNAWKVPEDIGRFSASVVCERAGENQWRLRLAARSVPAALLDWLRDKLADELLQPAFARLAANTSLKDAKQLAEYVRIVDATYDPAQQTIVSTIIFVGDLLPEGAPALPSARVTIDLRHGSVDLRSPTWKELSERLEAEARSLLDELGRRIEGDLNQAIAKRLEDEGVKLQILGAGFKVTKAVYRSGRVIVAVAGTGSLNGVTVDDIGIVKLDLESLNVELFDFRDAKVRFGGASGLQPLVSRLSGIEQDYLRIAQERWTVDGVRFDVLLNLELLGGELLLGTVALGRGGADVKPFDGLSAAFKKKVLDYLSRDVLVIPNLGPIRKLKLDPQNTTLLNGVQVWISGEAEVSGFGAEVGIPFSARLAPSFKLQLKLGALKQAATNAFLRLLPRDLFGGIENVELLTAAPPFGVKFDLKFDAWVFKIEANNLSLTTAGFDLPSEIAIQLPGMVPVPPAFAIVDPGVVLALKRNGAVGVVGDITVAGKGIDKIIKLRSKLTTSLSELGTFKLDGTMVLVEVLPIMKVEGIADFRTALLLLDARTTGFMDKILQVRAQTRISGKDGEFRQPGSLGVLGLRLAHADVQIMAYEPSLRAAAEVRIPIAKIMVKLKASPSLSDFEAKACFDVSLGGFTLSKASLLVNAQLVDLKFGVLIFDVRILAPSIATVTPGRVLSAILSLFDFDISALFRALISRKITISFFENTPDGPKEAEPSIGYGAPLPPDSRDNGAPPDSMAPPPGHKDSETDAYEEPADGGKPAITEPKVEAPADPPKDPSPPNDSPPPDRRDTDVIRYQTGNVAFDIIDDPKHPGLFVERYRWNGYKWLAPFSLTPQAADLLRKSSTMVLGALSRRLGGNERGTVKFRNGANAWYVRYYVVLTKAGKVLVVPRFPGALPKQIDIDLAKIGVESKAQDLFWLLLGRKEFHFTNGDLELIRRYAQSIVTPGHTPIGDHEYIKESAAPDRSALTQPAGYLFVTKNERGISSVEFITRSGGHVELRETQQLYTYLGLQNGTGAPRTRAVLRLLSSAEGDGRRVTYLYGGSTGPLLLVVGPTPTDPVTRLYAVKSDGNFSSTLTVVAEQIIWQGSFDSVWPAGHPLGALGAEVAAQIESVDWDELLFLQHNDGEVRVVLATGLNAPEGSAPPDAWSFRLLRLPDGGPLVREGSFDGAGIADDWPSWCSDGSLRVTPHEALESSEARRWLINELMASPDKRRGDWIDDPVDLVHLHVINP